MKASAAGVSFQVGPGCDAPRPLRRLDDEVEVQSHFKAAPPDGDYDAMHRRTLLKGWPAHSGQPREASTWPSY